MSTFMLTITYSWARQYRLYNLPRHHTARIELYMEWGNLLQTYYILLVYIETD